MRLQSKKGKENFKEAVKKCISRDLLTTERIRKFSRHACQYICAYYKIYNEQKNREQQQQHQTYQVDESTTPVKLEKLVKEFKTHRCAMDFDSSFCKVIFTEGESTLYNYIYYYNALWLTSSVFFFSLPRCFFFMKINPLIHWDPAGAPY